MGGGGNTDMMTTLFMLEAMRNSQGGSGSSGPGQPGVPSQGGFTQSMASMLGDSGSGTQRIM